MSEIITPNGITIRVLAEDVPIEYDEVPDWSDEPAASFEYNGYRYFLDEFEMLSPDCDEARAGWEAGYGECYWSELLIKGLYGIEDTVTIARASW